MRQIFILLFFITAFLNGQSQGITLLYKGAGGAFNGGWKDPLNWVQVNAAAGQTPIQRIPTELDDVIFSGPQSGLTRVYFGFSTGDTVSIGGNTTAGYRCRRMRISKIDIEFNNGGELYTNLHVYTSNGGQVIIDSGANFQRGHFVLLGGNPAINDLEIRNSNFGSLFSHNAWSTINIGPNGRARFEGSTFGGHYFGSQSNGGELYADNCVFTTTNFYMGDHSTLTLLNSNFVNDNNNVSMSFRIGHNAIVNTANVNVTPLYCHEFYTSGAILNGNLTILRETTNGSIFGQKYPSNPRPNIINGNCTFKGGIGSLGIKGDLKISGNFINNGVDPLMYPDTAHVFIDSQHIFKMGGITNYRKGSFINNCTQDLCHFKLEFFGNSNSNIAWPIGIPIDTLIINKTGCAKVTATNSLYVSGETRIQSGQLLLNPNDGIPYKLVCAGDLNIFPGGGLLLRKSNTGSVANMAVAGDINDYNLTIDTTCFGFGNPHTGNVTMYLVQPGSGSSTISLLSNGNIGNLDLAAGRGTDFILHNNLTVNNFTFGNNNRLLLGNNQLAVNGNILNYGPGNYFVTNGSGSLRINNVGNAKRIFPVGPSTTAYNPVSILNSGIPDDFSVNVSPHVLAAGISGSPYIDTAVNKTWNIIEAVAGGSKVELEVQWNANDELPGFTRKTAYLAHHLAGTWNKGTPMPAQGSGPYTLTRDNIASFSPFAVLGSAAIIPVTQDISFSIFPNPVKDQLTVKLPGTSGNVDIKLVDGKGITIRRSFSNVAGSTSVTIPVKGLPAGIYTIHLHVGNSAYSRQFIKE